MKLTAFTDYSLRLLIYLAADPQRRTTIAQVCGAINVKQNHLTKVVHHLGKCGWVETTRGKHGGLVLARPAERIRIGDVVRDTEGPAVPAECFVPGEGVVSCGIAASCRLRGTLAEAVNAFYAVLDRHTLADIAPRPGEAQSIVHLFPPPHGMAVEH